MKQLESKTKTNKPHKPQNTKKAADSLGDRMNSEDLSYTRYKILNCSLILVSGWYFINLILNNILH